MCLVVIVIVIFELKKFSIIFYSILNATYKFKNKPNDYCFLNLHTLILFLQIKVFIHKKTLWIKTFILNCCP